MIIDFMKQNEEIFNAYIFEESWKEHCQEIENLGEWGTQAEIYHCNIVEKQIFAFTWESHSQLYPGP